MSIKSQRKARKIQSRRAAIRLREEEWAGLQQLATTLGQTPSRILRRLLREALTGGPDYFTDERVDWLGVRRELAALGRNLNQLTKAVHQGEWPDGALVRRTLNATRVQVAGVKAVYDQAIETVATRAVVALSGAERGVLRKRGGRRFGPLQ